MDIHIAALSSQVTTSTFECGEPQLDTYLKRYATQDVKRGVARVFVATPIAAPRSVVGFYTLSAASISTQTLPDVLRKRLPLYPVPVALLGRLAVSQQAQGLGLGSMLLADACKRVAAASETLAVAAMVVDAMSPQAGAFYKHMGFIELPGQPGRWMLPKAHFIGSVVDA